jgi:hypothetical protein
MEINYMWEDGSNPLYYINIEQVVRARIRIHALTEEEALLRAQHYIDNTGFEGQEIECIEVHSTRLVIDKVVNLNEDED